MQRRRIEIDRVISLPRSNWTTGRYVRQWTAWMIENLSDVDIVIAVGARDEAVAAIDATRQLQIPVIVWPTFSIGESDVGHWQASRTVRRYVSAIRRADAVAVDDAVEHRTLVSQGIAADRVVHVQVPMPASDRSSGFRSLDRPAARRALASVNADLATEPNSIVVTTSSPMIRGGPIEAFCQSLLPVNAAWPQARFWIIGDGPARHRLHTQLRGDGLRDVIAMPGSFNETRDVVMASDIIVHLDTQPTVGLLRAAVAVGRTIVVLRSDRNRSWVESAVANHGDIVHWCDADAPSIKSAIRSAIKGFVTRQSDANSSDAASVRRGIDPAALGGEAWPDLISRMCVGVRR